MPCAVHKTSDFHYYDGSAFGNFCIYKLLYGIARILVLSLKRYRLLIEYTDIYFLKHVTVCENCTQRTNMYCA